MKSEWDERARENAMHYVASGSAEWDKAEFLASGGVDTDDFVVKDLDVLTRGLDPGQMVMLEIGCGPGRMTRYLADIFGRVEAVDVSGEMIALARENLGSRANVGLHETSGADLAPFSDATFDLCFSYITFQHIPSREAVVSYLEEVHRTLKSERPFKFQVHGEAPIKKPTTWHGVRFSEDEMRELADEIGFEVLQMSGQGTQYFWNWWIRR